MNDAPNAPGVQVFSTAKWVGSNDTSVSHSYGAAAATTSRSSSRSRTCRRRSTRRTSGFNITPYDDDDTSAAGTTTLRHIDLSTRMAWSTFGSVQSDPYRWGRAVMAGYTPPAAQPTTPAAPDVSHPNLDGVNSPETIAASARNGVPISGRTPAPANDSMAISNVILTPSSLTYDIDATGAGTAHTFLWTGEKGYIPVWNTSCTLANDPAPDFGFTACALTDGSIPAWGTDMSGHVVRDQMTTVAAGKTARLDPAGCRRLREAAVRGSALVSFETPNDEVQAFDVPLMSTSTTGPVSGTVPATLSLTLGTPASFGPFTAGKAMDYFASTTANVISSAGDALLSVSDPSSVATGHLVNGTFSLPQPLQARARNAANTGTAYNNVGSSASPLNLLTWSAPISNDALSLDFKQSIGANDALRTGTYSKTLVFTLSTTSP